MWGKNRRSRRSADRHAHDTLCQLLHQLADPPANRCGVWTRLNQNHCRAGQDEVPGRDRRAVAAAADLVRLPKLMAASHGPPDRPLADTRGRSVGSQQSDLVKSVIIKIGADGRGEIAFEAL
jgi:citrate lyase beta subunit